MTRKSARKYGRESKSCVLYAILVKRESNIALLTIWQLCLWVLGSQVTSPQTRPRLWSVPGTRFHALPSNLRRHATSPSHPGQGQRFRQPFERTCSFRPVSDVRRLMELLSARCCRVLIDTESVSSLQWLTMFSVRVISKEVLG